MSAFLPGSLLLVAAVFALGNAAWRAAALTGATGLERAIAAAPLFVATAVAEALALGTVGLAGSQVALGLAALATWLAARHWLPRPEPNSRRPGAAPSHRLAVAGLAGVSIGWTVWALRIPQLGLDGSTYHLSAVANWVIHGTTGHSLDLYTQIPVGSYPLTNEAALAWAVGLAQSWAPVAAWTAGIAALLVGSAWLGLRELSVPRVLAGLAIAALCAVPVALRGLVHAETDVPAVAWLVCTGALAACVPRRPALAAPMLVAGALAIGTKTTTLPLTALVVALGMYAARGSLRRLAVPLALAAALGLVAGGLWYVRNLVAHGSPLWPFVSLSWGDPVPSLFDRVNFSLLERPRATLEGQWPIYRLTLSGGLVLLAAGVLSPIWSRRRAVLAAAAVTLAATLVWAAAPFTGAGAAAFLQVNTLRYILPAMAAGALAIALSGRYGKWPCRLATAALLGSLVWSAKTYLDDAYLRGEGTLILAMAIATPAAVLLLRAKPRSIAVIAAAGATLLAAAGGNHYVERHGRAADFDSNVVTWFTTQRAWQDDSRPISFSPTPLAMLSGNRLHHPLELIGPRESCAQVLRRARKGWLVVREVDRALFGTLPAELCLAPYKPFFDDGIHRVYGPG